MMQWAASLIIVLPLLLIAPLSFQHKTAQGTADTTTPICTQSEIQNDLSANNTARGGPAPPRSDLPKDKLPFVLSLNATKTGIVTNGIEESIVRIGLYENETGRAVPNATFAVNIGEGRQVPGIQRNVSDYVIHGWFYAENGTVSLKLLHGEGEETAIQNATNERAKGAVLFTWIPDVVEEPISICSPEIREDAVYDIQVTVLTAYDAAQPLSEMPSALFIWNPQKDNDIAAKAVIVPEFETILLPMLVATGVGIAAVYSRIKN